MGIPVGGYPDFCPGRRNDEGCDAVFGRLISDAGAVVVKIIKFCLISSPGNAFGGLVDVAKVDLFSFLDEIFKEVVG
jgi:hypothetical protein